MTQTPIDTTRPVRVAGGGEARILEANSEWRGLILAIATLQAEYELHEAECKRLAALGLVERDDRYVEGFMSASHQAVEVLRKLRDELRT